MIAAIAFVSTPTDIAKAFKTTYTARHKAHIQSGNLEAGSASLKLAAGVNAAMKQQESTFQRRRELVQGVVFSRRSRPTPST